MPTRGFVYLSIDVERAHQDQKWGPIDQKKQSVAGYLLVMERELAEAKEGWMKNIPGKHSSLAEIVQIAATAVACLEQHGLEGNPL